MIDIHTLTIKKAQIYLANGSFSAEELVSAHLQEIEKRNPELNAYLEVFQDAKENAKRRDAVRKEKGSGGAPLLGIPIALKDNILVKGKKTSCASKILENYSAAYDATVTAKLTEAGAVFLGRTNMDEFAMGSSTENSAFGAVRNPYDMSRVPGGSSGGSAAAVASGIALGALGSDTGGSVRQPASFCGVVGLKPTYGAVSRYGLVAMASSLDQIGPIAKTVEDARILFDVISGHDPMDSTSIQITNHKSQITNKKIGVPYHLLEKGVDEDVLGNFNASLEKLKGAGYEIVPIELHHASYSLPVYYIIMPAEASTNLARFDGMRYGLHESGENLFADYALTRGKGFGEEVRRRIILGTYVLSSGYYDAFYTKAREVRARIKADFGEAFKTVSAIALPTSPIPAFQIGERANDPLAMYLADVFTVPANIAGVPAISIPSGFVSRSNAKLPVGLQVIAPWMREDILFDIGTQFEQLVKANKA